jgi:hypothetical protein
MRLRIDQNGAESAQLATNSSFVIVRVPITVLGEALEAGAIFRFGIGSFRGRETPLLLQAGAQAKLTFRIPKELFRPKERLRLEVIARDTSDMEEILWAKRYEAGWLGSVPHLEPMTDHLLEVPEDQPQREADRGLRLLRPRR